MQFKSCVLSTVALFLLLTVVGFCDYVTNHDANAQASGQKSPVDAESDYQAMVIQYYQRMNPSSSSKQGSSDASAGRSDSSARLEADEAERQEVVPDKRADPSEKANALISFMLLRMTKNDLALIKDLFADDSLTDQHSVAKKVRVLKRIKRLLVSLRDGPQPRDTAAMFEHLGDSGRSLAREVVLLIDDLGRLLEDGEPKCITRSHQAAFVRVREEFFDKNGSFDAQIKASKSFDNPVLDIIAHLLRNVAKYCNEKLNAKLGKHKHIIIVSPDKEKAESIDIRKYARDVKLENGGPSNKLSENMLAKVGVLNNNFNIVGFLPDFENSAEVSEPELYAKKFSKGLTLLERDCKILVPGYTALFNIYNSFGVLSEKTSYRYLFAINNHAQYLRLCKEITDTKRAYLSKLKAALNSLSSAVNAEIDLLIEKAPQDKRASFNAGAKFTKEFMHPKSESVASTNSSPETSATSNVDNAQQAPDNQDLEPTLSALQSLPTTTQNPLTATDTSQGPGMRQETPGNKPDIVEEDPFDSVFNEVGSASDISSHLESLNRKQARNLEDHDSADSSTQSNNQPETTESQTTSSGAVQESTQPRDQHSNIETNSREHKPTENSRHKRSIFDSIKSFIGFGQPSDDYSLLRQQMGLSETINGAR